MRMPAVMLIAGLSLSGAGARLPPGALQAPQKIDPETAQPVTEAIEKALRGENKSFHLESHCLTPESLRAVELFSNGVGVWSGKAQIQIQPAQLKSILVLLKDSGFAGMRESYGGKNDPAPGSNRKPPFASRITCRVEVTIDGVTKQANQFLIGRQSDELKKLVNSILDICEESAGEGIEAASLDDALAKLADGTFRPEVLKLVVNRKPDPEALSRGVPGWILTAEGGVARVRDHLAPRGMTDEVARQLPREKAASLASLLRKEHLSSLPANIYASHYTDVTIEILGHRKNVQARQFSGLSASSKTLHKKQFQRIFRSLLDLYEDVRLHGRPSSD